MLSSFTGYGHDESLYNFYIKNLSNVLNKCCDDYLFST